MTDYTTGLRAVSPVRNTTTSATGQAALNAVLLPMADWADCHPDVISCVASLRVAHEIFQPEDSTLVHDLTEPTDAERAEYAR